MPKEWLLLKLQLALVASISESLSKSGDILVAVSLALLVVLLRVVSSNQDGLSGLDSGGSSLVALHVSSVLVLIEGSNDIFDAVDSDSGLGSDLSLGLED